MTEELTEQTAFRVDWFAPERPVTGTVFVKTPVDTSAGVASVESDAAE